MNTEGETKTDDNYTFLRKKYSGVFMNKRWYLIFLVRESITTSSQKFFFLSFFLADRCQWGYSSCSSHIQSAVTQNKYSGMESAGAGIHNQLHWASFWVQAAGIKQFRVHLLSWVLSPKVAWDTLTLFGVGLRFCEIPFGLQKRVAAMWHISLSDFFQDYLSLIWCDGNLSKKRAYLALALKVWNDCILKSFL